MKIEYAMPASFVAPPPQQKGNGIAQKIQGVKQGALMIKQTGKLSIMKGPNSINKKK